MRQLTAHPHRVRLAPPARVNRVTVESTCGMLAGIAEHRDITAAIVEIHDNVGTSVGTADDETSHSGCAHRTKFKKS